MHIHSSSSGAIFQIHIHTHPHRFTNQGVHQAHPGIGKLCQPLGPAPVPFLFQCVASKKGPVPNLYITAEDVSSLTVSKVTALHGLLPCCCLLRAC